MCCKLGLYQDLTSLELTTLCPKQLRPQKWQFKSGKSSTSIFPSTPSSIQQLRYYNQSEEPSLLTVKQLRILQKRRMLPYFPSRYLHITSYRTLPQEMKSQVLWKYKTIKKPPLSHCLNAILKGAKNLQSLLVELERDVTNFKVIRKARGLQQLDFTIKTSQIMEYPHLFKYLTNLEKVKLQIRWSTKSETRIINKFFGFLFNLPKLQHLTIWLNYDEEGYYKILLSELHTKKLISFHIIALSSPSLPKSQIDWAKCIDTLYLGLLPPLGDRCRINEWPLTQKTEKKLSLNRIPEIDELIHERATIKNLELSDCIYISYWPDGSHNGRLFEIISKMKTLESLTLAFGKVSTTCSQIYEDFNKKFSQIESFENLTTLNFIFIEQQASLQKISPPFNNKMKNLKTLSLNLVCCNFDFSDFQKALEDLAGLENFNFTYQESGQQNFLIPLYCKFPFKKLENLKSICLNCNRPFSKASMSRLCKSISQMDSLELLKIEGKILCDIERKQASVFIGDLCLKKNLKFADFCWKKSEVSQWSGVNMKRVNAGMIVCSELKI